MGPIEEFLVDRVVDAMWRLRRWVRADTALLHSRMQGLKAGRLANKVRSYEKDIPQLFYSPPPPPTITDEAAHAEALEALGHARYEQDRDEVLLGCAFDADAKAGDTFGKLARYQRSLERSLLRNLNELRQMQDKRRNRRSSSISDAVISDTDDTERQDAGKCRCIGGASPRRIPMLASGWFRVSFIAG